MRRAPASDVRIEDMSFAYWAKRFTGARRAETPCGDPGRASPRPAEPAAH